MSSVFYYKHSSVDPYLLNLRLIPLAPEKNTVLVMTRSSMMQVQRKSRKSVFFTFHLVISKSLHHFPHIQVNIIQVLPCDEENSLAIN